MSEKAMDGSVDEGAIECPGCGYDLRVTWDRCPECGRAFDRAKLLESRIPWVHRRELGRVRAWGRTVWMVLRRPRKLGAEVSRPVEWKSAKRFGWVTILVAGSLVGAVRAGVYPWLQPWGDVSMDNVMWMLRHQDPLYFTLDAPRGASVIAGWILPMVAGGAAVVWLARAGFWLMARERKDRASAVACYWAVWIGVLGSIAAMDLVIVASEGLWKRWPGGGLALLGILLLVVHLLAPVWGWLNMAWMLRGATNRGWPGVLGAAAGIEVLAIALFLGIGFVLNYALGLVALMRISVGL